MKGLGFKMANIHGDEMQNELEMLVGGQRGLLEKELKMPFLRAAEKISCQDPQRQKAWARPERQARCLRARGRSGIHQELHPRRDRILKSKSDNNECLRNVEINYYFGNC